MKKYLIPRILGLSCGVIVFFAQWLVLSQLLGRSYFFWGTEIVLGLSLLGLAFFLVWRPYQDYKKMTSLFLEDYLFDDFFQAPVQLSKRSEKVLDKMNKAINRASMLNDSMKYGHYLALQNQINPHFLYNTLEAIRGEAIVSGLTNVEKMTEALSTFFRYTISNIENLVTFRQELENVKDYYLIQKYRFGDKINLVVVIDDDDRREIEAYQMPKLILQPIVENSVHHGIENKLGKGCVTISAFCTESRLIIKVADDGIGMTETTLVTLNQRLHKFMMEETVDKEEVLTSKGGIAVINVNTRIKLLYGEDFGLRYESIEGIGTDVIISLPRYPVVKEA